jgi:molecular chaperone Hsp33
MGAETTSIPAAAGDPGAAEHHRPSFANGGLRLGMAAGGDLRWGLAEMTAMVEAARERLDLSPLACAALGRTMAGAVLLLRMANKDASDLPSRLMLEISGDGLLQRVIADADIDGSVRGMVSNGLVSLPPTDTGKLDVGGAIGSGMLRVTRARGGNTYTSQVALVSGEIGDDLAHYLHQSDQTRSVVSVGVLTRPQGVAAAGGMIIEALPAAGAEVLDRLERNLAAVTQMRGGISRLLEAEGPEAVIATFLAGLEPVTQRDRPLAYRCRCSRERLRRHLVMLPPEDRAYLYEDGKVIADCTFCGERYTFIDLEQDEPAASAPS